MTHAALFFALFAALLVGALLTMGGAVALEDSPRLAIDPGLNDADLRPLSLAVAAFGLLIFIAAASAIVAAIGGQ